MRASRRAGGVALLALAACSVDRSSLDEAVFACRDSTECLEGYACELVTRHGGFCAPRVSEPSACDATTAIGSGGEDVCLPECAPGTSCAEGGVCARADAFDTSVGMCLPEDTELCSTDDECGPGEACGTTLVRRLLRVFAGPVTFDDDVRMSCLGVGCAADPSRCAEDEDCLFSDPNNRSGLDFCLARCGANDACPAGLSCTQLPELGLTRGVCLPGLLGYDCRVDSNCLMGECTTIADVGSFCLASCETASGQVQCSPEREVDGNLNLFRCRDTAVGELCLEQGGYLGLCSDSSQCVEGLECMELPSAPDTKICVDRCTFSALAPDQDQDGDCIGDSFCAPASFLGLDRDFCAYDYEAGVPCFFDDQCQSGRCDTSDPTSCDDLEETRGCCA